MEEEFIRAVEDGFKLSKRLRKTKNFPPRPPPGMDRSRSLQPSSPMIYAVISDPAIVDNPDVPSYQPHVYGEIDPPALIPLLMDCVALEVDCYLDTALVTVKGAWRVHCVAASKCCDCRLVLPMGELGSVLGVEAATSRRSYSTRMGSSSDQLYTEKTSKSEVCGFANPQIFSIVIPKVTGGSILTISIRWVQKLIYSDGRFSITVPFTFPEFVNPSGNTVLKKEKISLNINGGPGKELMCQTTSHPLKEIRRQSGSVGYIHEAEVISWSRTDFSFSYSVLANDMFGGILLQSPRLDDTDQRDRLCLYLFPGTNHQRKVFRQEIIFIVDISESMNGLPLESVINALSVAMTELSPQDSFNIIIFNDATRSFSPSLARATKETVEKAIFWITQNCVASGQTNLSKPLEEAMHMLSKTANVIPHICIITDGAVEDERSICSAMKAYISKRGKLCPRISTFGIGSFCNHYFLRMLASIGRGQYDATFESESIGIRLQRFFKRITSVVLASITIDLLDEDNSFEVYPTHVPDLSVGCPLLLVGSFLGTFSERVRAKGLLPDMTEFSIDLKLEKATFPIEQAYARHQIDHMTAISWFSESKELEQKIIRLSIHSGVPSEFTLMFLQEEMDKDGALGQGKKRVEKQASVREKPLVVGGLRLGFGDVASTKENLPAGLVGGEPPEMTVQKAAARCCSGVADLCCCMCCIKACSKMNDQFAIIMAQVVTALSVLGCMACCSEICGGSSD
ncbi:inter-alpha-trypsin inhibitor heavy chain-like protein [Wolffia australiana]